MEYLERVWDHRIVEYLTGICHDYDKDDSNHSPISLTEWSSDPNHALPLSQSAILEVKTYLNSITCTSPVDYRIISNEEMDILQVMRS